MNNDIFKTAIVCSVLACLALVAGCATQQAIPDEQLSAPEILLYAESRRSDELGRIVLPVTINGQGPFYFLLDTGATHSVLSIAAAERLALIPDNNFSVSVRGVSGVRRAPTTMVGTFNAGSLVFHDVRMPVLTAAVLNDVDGILGMDSLGDTKLTADLDNDLVRIVTANGQPAPKSQSVVAFSSLSRRLIVTSARVGHIRVRAVLDTGGAHTLGNTALLRELVKDYRSQLKGAVGVGIIDATDSSEPALLTQMPGIRIGPPSIENLSVAFGRFSVFDKWGLNKEPALLLGMDAINLMGELTIDYRRKELQIAAAHEPPH